MNKLALKIPGYSDINPPSGIPEGGTNSVEKIIKFGITTLITVGIILCLIFIIYGGIKWITSGGDEKAIDTARKTITYAVIGLIVILGSYLILSIVGYFFGITYLSVPAGGGGPGPLPL